MLSRSRHMRQNARKVRGRSDTRPAKMLFALPAYCFVLRAMTLGRLPAYWVAPSVSFTYRHSWIQACSRPHAKRA
jgi:hypothetical protein